MTWLGVSPSTVSTALMSATFKVGLRSRATLIQLAGRLLGSSPESRPLASLTAAEERVAEHLRRGQTNAQIARHKGCSERTVANQVASILHKLQVPSRRAVAALTWGDSA